MRIAKQCKVYQDIKKASQFCGVFLKGKFMINQVRIMLYVDDVIKISKFWQDKLAGKVIATEVLPDGSQNIILQLTRDVQLSLFSKEFIKKFSPEVITNHPSLMIFTTNFEELHQKLAAQTEIMKINQTETFNFQDPEGNYFVIAKK